MAQREEQQTSVLRWVIRPGAAPSRVLQQLWRIVTRSGHGPDSRTIAHEWRDVPMEEEHGHEG